ncbi:MAG: hypothetical protein CFE26_07770 [Verrucomicrobiales bacterium VVV1]|nr:MAG: hypothetical protein CFE26_07770 [Verrucomicrobiales bacterium VVV1]
MEYIHNIVGTLFASFVCVVVWAKIAEWKDAREARLRGYRIDYLSPGLLRAGENEFGMSYEQDGVTLIFVGQETNGDRVLDLTSFQGDGDNLDFYRTHKDLIEDRMTTELSTKWKRARIIIKT